MKLKWCLKKDIFTKKLRLLEVMSILNPELRQQINQEPQDCDSNFEIDEFQLAKACIDFQPIVLLSKLDSVLTEA
jgi:hypothetical protein